MWSPSLWSLMRLVHAWVSVFHNLWSFKDHLFEKQTDSIHLNTETVFTFFTLIKVKTPAIARIAMTWIAETFIRGVTAMHGTSHWQAATKHFRREPRRFELRGPMTSRITHNVQNLSKLPGSPWWEFENPISKSYVTRWCNPGGFGESQPWDSGCPDHFSPGWPEQDHRWRSVGYWQITLLFWQLWS